MTTAPLANTAWDSAEISTRIGRRLVDLRTARNLRASDLARRISVSSSLIGQIERGRVRPSVRTLAALATALDVPVDAFLAEPSSELLAGGWTRTTVLRAAERTTIDVRDGVRSERLAPDTLEAVDFVQLVYRPGAESGAELTRHPGFEMLLVLENRFDVHVGFERNVLMEGDSIVFPAALPHRFVNPTGSVSRALAVLLHDLPMSPRPRVTQTRASAQRPTRWRRAAG